MVGAGEKVLRLTVGHAKTRVQFDAPIGVNQYIQGHCTDLLADVDGCRFVTHQAAWRLSENIPADYEVAVAKAWTSEAFERACFSAHSVFAGYGYTCKDGLLPMYSRRGKTQQLYFGNSRYWFGKVALELEKWTFERARGKPLGFWKTAACEQTPGWEVWDRGISSGSIDVLGNTDYPRYSRREASGEEEEGEVMTLVNWGNGVTRKYRYF
jgi:Acyl-CoA dehydrogenases